MLGADYVIDVQKEDPLERIKAITGGKGVDVVARLHGGRRNGARCCSASKR